MVLCDTNILVEFYKNTPGIIQEFNHIRQDQLAIIVITQAELYFGAVNKAELKRIRKHLGLLNIFSLDIGIS